MSLAIIKNFEAIAQRGDNKGPLNFHFLNLPYPLLINEAKQLCS